METVAGRPADHLVSRLTWWILFLLVLVYAAFALAMGASELGYLLGLTSEANHRTTPLVFVVHALAGAVALLIGPLQSFQWVRRRTPLRRALGRSYVLSVWIAAVAAVADALSFNVGGASKFVFVVVAVLWFWTTTTGMLRARARRFREQHEWMVRSYSLSLFFVSFSLWVPLLASTTLPVGVSHPLALFLSGALNLAVAEVWIRRHRTVASVRGE